MNAIETFVDLTMGDADAAVRAALADQGFGVLTEVDVAATSIAKIGADRAPLNILGACHPRLAYHPRARRVGELGPAGFEELAGGSDGAPAGRLGQREVNR